MMWMIIFHIIKTRLRRKIERIAGINPPDRLEHAWKYYTTAVVTYYILPLQYYGTILLYSYNRTTFVMPKSPNEDEFSENLRQAVLSVPLPPEWYG